MYKEGHNAMDLILSGNRTLNVREPKKNEKKFET